MNIKTSLCVGFISAGLLQLILLGCSQQSAPEAGGLLRELRQVHIQSVEIEDQVSAIDAVMRGTRSLSVVAKISEKIPLPLTSTEMPQRTSELNLRRDSLVQQYESLMDIRKGILDKAVNRLGKPESWLHAEVAFAMFLEQLHANNRARNARGFAANGISCPDIARDGLMHDLFNAIAVDDRVAYVRALGNFAKAYECYPAVVALGYNQDIVAAYQNTIVNLPSFFRDASKRSLLSALSNLLVISLDSVKAFGPSAMQQFILENRHELGEVFAQPSSPARLIGLWLYSAEAEQLVQISQLCEALNPAEINITTHCISAGAMLDAITNPWLIGTGACPLLTMLTPVFDPEIGYFCQRGICEQPGSAVPGLQEMLVSGETAYGASIDALQAQACPDGQSILGGGLTGLGKGHTDDIVACVSEQANQQRGNLQCFADIASSLRGTRGFVISAPASRHQQCGDPLATDPNDITKLLDTLEKWKKAHDDVKEWLKDPLHRETFITVFEAEFGVELTEEALQNAIEETQEVIVSNTEDELFFTEEEIAEHDAAEGKPVEGAMVAPPYRKGVIVNLFANRTREEGHNTVDVLKAISQYLACTLTNTCDEKAASRLGVREEDEEETEQAEDVDVPEEGEKEYCRPELGDCEDCSPGAGTRKMLMACMSGNEEPSPLDILPGGGFTDPVPWDTDESWAGCFSREPDSINLSLACISLDCGQEQAPVVENGQCVCRTPAGTPPVTNQCAYINCGPDSFPVITPGGCMCQAQGQPGLTPAAGEPGSGVLFNQQ